MLSHLSPAAQVLFGPNTRMNSFKFFGILLVASAFYSVAAISECDESEQFLCTSRFGGKECCYKNGKYCDALHGCTRCPVVGQVSCDGVRCTDLLSDAARCGSCSTPCMPGYSCCSGSCYSLQDNTDNCGRCNHNCQPSEVCRGGRCVDPS